MWTSLLLQTLTTGAGTSESAASEVTADVIQQVDVSLLDLLMEGGWYIMTPLALMSIMAIYVFFERSLAIRKAERVTPDFMNKLRD
ncbi:MAG: hypothetical protein MUP94_06825, partial [Flavobacteriales bacterium]|nr:hypothetical protein [Flavobacteriales bacterium]